MLWKERLANVLAACWFSEPAEKTFTKQHDLIVFNFSRSREQHFLRNIVLPHEVLQSIACEISDAFFSSEDLFSERVNWKRAQIKLFKNKFFRSVVDAADLLNDYLFFFFDLLRGENRVANKIRKQVKLCLLAMQGSWTTQHHYSWKVQNSMYDEDCEGRVYMWRPNADNTRRLMCRSETLTNRTLFLIGRMALDAEHVFVWQLHRTMAIRLPAMNFHGCIRRRTRANRTYHRARLSARRANSDTEVDMPLLAGRLAALQSRGAAGGGSDS